MDIKIGMICRDNNRGLGIQSWEFYKNLRPVKTLVIEISEKSTFRNRYPEARFCQDKIEDKDLDWFLDGIDCLISFETWYRKDIPEIAKKRGIKTILYINWEWFCEEADLYLVPSLWHFSEIPGPKEYLPVPINRKKLKFRLRKQANIFYHNTGNLLAGYDRNGTEIFLRAIPLVKSNVQFVIKSQVELPRINDRRVKYIIEDVKNYWDQWKTEADIMVLPRRYGGLCLPLNEAMSVGMPVIMPDSKPQNQFLPRDLLVKVSGSQLIKIKKVVELANINPVDVARKIDEFANKDITKYSKIMDEIAEAWSWDRLKPHILKIIKKLCQK